jgi:sugar-phosphatase
MIKGVVFDFDGVIIDSEPFWRQAEVNAFAHFGYSISFDDVMKSGGKRDRILDFI